MHHNLSSWVSDASRFHAFYSRLNGFFIFKHYIALKSFEYHSLHALSRLTGNVNQLDHLKLGLDDVQVVVETRAFTPLCNNSQLGFGGVAHEEQDVHMAGFPAGDKEFSISFDRTMFW